MSELYIWKHCKTKNKNFQYKYPHTKWLDHNQNKTLKYWVSVQWVQSWGEDASLALVGHPSSDSIIKIPYGVDIFLHQPDLHPIFSYWVS